MGKERWIASASIHRRSFTKLATTGQYAVADQCDDSRRKIEDGHFSSGAKFTCSSRIYRYASHHSRDASFPLQSILLPHSREGMTSARQFLAIASPYNVTSCRGSDLRCFSSFSAAYLPAPPENATQAQQRLLVTPLRGLPFKVDTATADTLISIGSPRGRRTRARINSTGQEVTNFLLTQLRKYQETLEEEERKFKASATLMEARRICGVTEIQRNSAEQRERVKAKQDQKTQLSSSGVGGFAPSEPKRAEFAFIPSLVALQDFAAAGSQPLEQFDEHRPLTFHIPTEDLRKAMQSSKNVASAYWSHTLYRGPDGQQVIVHYCRSRQTAEKVAQLFLYQSVLGFDIEWKPMAKATSGIKSNVSLIQLASEDRIALFQLAMHKGETAEEILPPTLRLILENPNVMKAGVAIRSDFKRLRTHLNISPAGLIELSHLHNLVTYSVSDPTKVTKKLVGLTNQVEAHLQLPLSKGEVRTSDWSRELTYEQCFYAAADAYAGLRIFHVLEAKRKAMNPVPPRPAFAELMLPLHTYKLDANSNVITDETAFEAEDEALGENDPDDGDIQNLSLDSQSAERTKEISTSKPNANHVDEEIHGSEPLSSAYDVAGVSKACLDEDVTSDGVNATGRERPLDKSGLFVNPILDAGNVASEMEESKEDLLRRFGNQFDEADQWAKEKAASVDKSRHIGVPLWHRSTAGKAAFRAYALWEHHQLSVGEIAKLVGIKDSTVATYVAECLHYESLHCSDYMRLRDLLEVVSYGRQARYRQLKEYAMDVTKGQLRQQK